MAEAVKRKAMYTSYGNVAYDPNYLPDREEEGQVYERPVIRPRERVRSRTRVMVRPAGRVAPVAVIGFVAVAVVAVMILMCTARIAVASSEVVSLRKESAALEEENRKLLNQYELAYDLKTVEEIATTEGGMVVPQAGQKITMDLSEPDSAQMYQQSRSFFGRLWDGITGTVGNIVEFFS